MVFQFSGDLLKLVTLTEYFCLELRLRQGPSLVYRYTERGLTYA